MRPTEGVSPAVLVGASGVSPTVTLGGPVRAILRHSGGIYAVSDGTLWRVSGTERENLGSLTDDPATQMVSNGSQIGIVAGGKYYVYDGSTFQSYTTGALSRPIGIAYQDGYFLLIGSSGGRNDALTISGLDNGKTFNALEFAFAENSPDELRGIISDHGELWLFGTSTIEVFFNSGAADFPFQRNSGALIEHGCLDGRTIAKEDNAVFWIGEDGVAYRSGGGTPEVISTREVEEVFADASIECGFTFMDRGHKFYAVCLKDKPTWCFDLTTGLWSERSRGASYEPWSATCSTRLGGAHYFGTSTGKVATLDRSVFTDDGAVMAAEAVSIPLVQGGDEFSISRIHLNISSGHYDIGREPQIMMQTSKDGHNWGVERWRDLGRLGEFYKEIRWHGLGQFKRFQVRLRITDEVSRDIYGAAYE